MAGCTRFRLCRFPCHGPDAMIPPPPEFFAPADAKLKHEGPTYTSEWYRLQGILERGECDTGAQKDVVKFSIDMLVLRAQQQLTTLTYSS